MNETIEKTVAANYQAVKDRIAEAARKCARDPDGVTLVAISKRQPLERIEAALEAGHRVFGENRVQEAEGHWVSLKEKFSGIRLHLVGPLQSNKVKPAVALFDVIETVDRPKIANALAKEMNRTGKLVPCFIQINTGEEPQKAGVVPGEADDFIAFCRNEAGLKIQGLMCIPPFGDDPAPHFALLADMAERNGLRGLSMGMSADYETAIRFGATHIRVGTAIFGERES